MPITYLKSDQTIINGIDINIGGDGGTAPVGGRVEVDGDTSGHVPLQFPPRLNSDGKSGNWKTFDASSYEPVAIFSGSEPRRIAIELTYVVDGNSWTGSKISSIERMIKSYFYHRVEDVVDNTPIVVIKQLYGVVGLRMKTTWRMKSADISFGEGIIIEDGFAYPLSRKITMELETYTQMGGRGGDDVASDAGAQGAKEAKNVNIKKSTESGSEQATPSTSTSEEVKQFQQNLNVLVNQMWY